MIAQHWELRMVFGSRFTWFSKQQQVVKLNVAWGQLNEQPRFSQMYVSGTTNSQWWNVRQKRWETDPNTNSLPDQSNQIRSKEDRFQINEPWWLLWTRSKKEKVSNWFPVYLYYYYKLMMSYFFCSLLLQIQDLIHSLLKLETWTRLWIFFVLGKML